MDNLTQPKKTVRLRTPNPLFEKWLSEWHTESVSLDNPVTVYSQALESLRKFPLVLKSGLECIILEHFDNNLCLKLNKKLEQHQNQIGIRNDQAQKHNGNQKQDLQEPLVSSKTNKTTQNSLAADLSQPKASPAKRKTKAYKPAKRSAAYALLIALLLKEREIGSSGFMTKAELMAKAQVHCDVSLKKPAPGTYYSGWSSMSQLVSKSLVERSGNPAKFFLTEKGRELAHQLKSNDLVTQTASSIVPEVHEDQPVLSLGSPTQLIMRPKPRGRKKKEASEQSESGGTSAQSQEFETEEMIFLPSSFDVILLVDTAETAGSAKRDEDEAIIGLTKTGIKFEVRHLKVGDYVWICRDSLGREMVLPYIVERKRLDDLGSSIKDGRFHEQKFRLKQCGLPNRIYLVEDSGQDRNGLPLEHIHQAVTNTLACDKFSIKVTRNLLESMSYLAKVTKILTETFQSKTLLSCKKEDLPAGTDLSDDIISLLSFNDFSFNMGKMKAFTPREIFAKQLIQMHGLSADKAWVITEHYCSPKELIEGFLHGEAETVISQLTCGILERKVGSQIASTLKLFYTTHHFTG